MQKSEFRSQKSEFRIQKSGVVLESQPSPNPDS